MSSAHALVRFFSPGSHAFELDASLAKALAGPTVDWDVAARTYAESLEDVCAREATAAQPLPAVSVEDAGGIAVIHPGTGEVTLPPGTRAVAIDLRGLTEAPGLEEALARAIAVASTRPVARVSHRVRRHAGLTDEFNARNIYSNTTALLTSPPYAASGQAELPVALLTSAALPPTAARFAVDLRAAGRAWLHGEPVATAVAESSWAPIGAQGLAIRLLQLADAEGPLPDLLPADRTLQASLADSLRELPTAGTPGALDRSVTPARARMVPRTPQLHTPPAPEQSAGIARADLLIIHGTMRRFFPYFAVVGDGLDARLEETLAAVDATPVSRERIRLLLRRLGAVLQDGHGFVIDMNPPAVGILPARMEEVAGAPVVHRSLVPELRPGDTLVRIGSQSTSDWYAEELGRTSAATPGYRFDLATRRLGEQGEPLTLGLRAVDGSERTETVKPWAPADAAAGLGPWGSRRAAGFLGDLGAPSVYYINLAGEVLTRLVDFRTQLKEAAGARGLVLDMRDYPAIDHSAVAQHLLQDTVFSAIFRTRRWTGPDQLDFDELQYANPPLPEPSFTGPIVLLVGPHTVSAAENFSIMLVAQKRVRVVGQRSAGTNGNVTMLVLPGAFRFISTGTEVLFPDRSTFHGVGIVPDVAVAPTAEDLAAGRDSELLGAIELLLQ
jgi:hypothetical protein